MVNFLWDNLFRKDQKAQDVSAILKENIVFSLLSIRDLKFVSELVHIRSYRPGEYIFQQGEIGVGMYIIMTGEVDIKVDLGFGSGDENAFVTRLEPHDFFGEISLIEPNSRRTASAMAHSHCTLVGFFKPDLTEVLERNPTMGVKILSQLAEVLAKRLKETSKKITELRQELSEIQHGQKK